MLVLLHYTVLLLYPNTFEVKLLQNLARDGLGGVEDKLRATTFRPLAVILELGFVFLNILGVDFLVDLSLLILLLDVTNSVIDDGDAKPDCTNFFLLGASSSFYGLSSTTVVMVLAYFFEDGGEGSRYAGKCWVSGKRRKSKRSCECDERIDAKLISSASGRVKGHLIHPLHQRLHLVVHVV